MYKLFSSSVATATVNPIASLEALQEITDICNSIQLSTPAFEALMELPLLAQEFDNASTAKLSMLNFVAEQHYDTLGLTNVSVSQESVVDSVVNGVKKAYEWVKKKLGELKDWFMSFFRKKPVEQMQAEVKQAEEVVKNSAVVIEEAIKDVQSGKPVKVPETIGGLDELMSGAHHQHNQFSPGGKPSGLGGGGTPIMSGHGGKPVMNVVKEIIKKPDVTVQELQEVKAIVVNVNKVVADIKQLLPTFATIIKTIEGVSSRFGKMEKDLETIRDNAEMYGPNGRNKYNAAISVASRLLGAIGRLAKVSPVLVSLNKKLLGRCISEAKLGWKVNALEDWVNIMKEKSGKLKDLTGRSVSKIEEVINGYWNPDYKESDFEKMAATMRDDNDLYEGITRIGEILSEGLTGKPPEYKY